MNRRTFCERPELVNGYPFIKLKGGRLVSFWDMITAAESAETDFSRAISRAYKLLRASQPDGDDFGLPTGSPEFLLERLEDRLTRMEEYIDAVRAEIAKCRATDEKRERIARLRNVAGRTPEEAEAYRLKADELEAALTT